jgi:hypothetical protein
MQQHSLIEETFTHHFVDDVAPQEQAIEVFHTYSSFSVMNTSLSPDGRTLRYKIRDLSMTLEYLRRSRLVIKIFDLPLDSSIDAMEVEGTLIQATLVIKYTGK